MANVELDLLPLYGLFALVVRHQSFSMAARETGLTRSAVSQRIARLEAKLGLELLRRTTRRVAPTAQGLALYEAASRLLDETGDLQRLGPRREAPLKVNAPLALATAALTTLLNDFQRQSPGPIELAVESRPIDLFDAKDDVVVRVARQLPGGVVGRRLAKDRIVCVAAPAYVAKQGAPASPQELLRHRCLRYRPTPAELEWRFTPPRGAPFSVPVSASFTVDDGTVLQHLVRDGAGVAAMPHFMVKGELARGHLTTLLDGWAMAPLEVWGLLPAGRKAPPRARALVELLARTLASRL